MTKAVLNRFYRPTNVLIYYLADRESFSKNLNSLTHMTGDVITSPGKYHKYAKFHQIIVKCSDMT